VNKSRIRFLGLALSVAFALQAHAAPSGVRAKDEQDALALSPAADQAYGPDLRGRHISDDIRELVAQFGHEGTSAPGGSLIPDPKNLSQYQRGRAQTLFEYWALYPALTNNRDVWVNFLARNHLAPDSAHSATVLSAERALQDKLGSGHIAGEWTELGRRLLQSYIDERNQLVRDSAAADDAEQARATPCPAPASKLSATAKPKFDRGGRSLAEFWPQESRRRGEEGIVMVKLHVSTTGCASSAAVSGSSGFPDLDAAVMKFYETLTFLPAQENGAAVEAVVNIPVNFKLDGLGAR
jgi:TonB family protein